MDKAICANYLFLSGKVHVPKVSPFTWIVIWARTNTLHFPSKSSALSSLSSAQMPARSSWTQVPLSHCVKKAPNTLLQCHRTSEWRWPLTRVCCSFSWVSGCRLWPTSGLLESPVLVRGMLWLTCPVTPALTPTAALHRVLGVCLSSHCNCPCVCQGGLRGSIHAWKYACSMQCIFVCVSSEVVLTLDTCCLTLNECVKHRWSLVANPEKSGPDHTD